MATPLTESEKRFLRYWEEQRAGGKWQFFAIYAVGLTILVFILCIAVGLFMSVSIRDFGPIIGASTISIVSGISLSFFIWYYQEKKFKNIIKRYV